MLPAERGKAMLINLISIMIAVFLPVTLLGMAATMIYQAGATHYRSRHRYYGSRHDR